MKNRETYYAWFRKMIAILIDLFFHICVGATLYVFTSVLQGSIRIILFLAFLAAYVLILYLFYKILNMSPCH